ncbi:MAG: YHYH domain-containing protein [Hyphomicrobiaceae bacterium]
MKLTLLALAIGMTVAAGAFAHSGGTDAAGCHFNHKTGVYHCH